MKKELGIFTGKTPEEAYKKALSDLGMTEDRLQYEVLEKGKVTFLGIGSIKAQISVYTEEEEEIKEVKKSPEREKEEKVVEKKAIEKRADGKETDGERAVRFLEGLMELLNVKATPVLVKEEEKIEIDLSAEKSHDVIGKRGVMLDAIQNLAGAVANIGRDDYKRVVVDCDGYREKRDHTLAHVANKTAEKAVRLGRKISLEPMSAYERRIIHSTLANNEDVKTASEGKEPHRFVVIIPNELTPYEKRNYNGKGGRNGRGNNRRGERREVKRDFRTTRTYTEEEKAERSKVGGGTSTGIGGERPAYKKSSSVVFGTFLGNSLKDEANKTEE